MNPDSQRRAAEMPGNGERSLAPGERIHDFDEAGGAWRVAEGVVRLDARHDAGDPAFAGLALAGDIIGAEALLFGRCTFRAIALTPCRLTPWPGAAEEGPSPLQALARIERRAAHVVALRAGQAADRVTRLMRLLMPAAGMDSLAVLPPLRDMADITALTIETVSRALSGLRRQGILSTEGPRRGPGRKTCRIALDPRAT